MKITHYLYNTFVIESEERKIVIDPGALFFYFFRFTSLLPESEWKSITHILVTHGHPDHYWHTSRLAASGGEVSWRDGSIDGTMKMQSASFRPV